MANGQDDDQKIKKRIPFSKNNAFCIAPWTHTYISPQSERRMCCASREQHSFMQQYIDQAGEGKTASYQPLTLEEHWNSDHMRSIRRKMLSGEAPAECMVCNEQVLNIYTYKSYFNKVLFPHHIQKAYDLTDDTGRTSMRPVSYDYRLANTCNFKCRMCGEPLSSSWEQEKRQYSEWDPNRDIWMQPHINAEIKKFQREVVEQEFARAITSGTMEEIYWVGGEPLMWEQHWRYMQDLVDLGFSKNVHVRYNTNLSKIVHKGVHLFDDILPHFKSYNVCASIDAAGKVGEFVRTGLNWEKWLENFKSGLPYMKKRGADSLIMDVTLTLPGLFGMKELHDLAIELDVKMYVKIVFAFDPSIVLSPFAAPKKVLHSILDDLLREIEPKANSKTMVLVETLKEMKNRPTFEEAYPDTYQEGFLRGRDQQRRLARYRKDGEESRLTIEQIYERNPALSQWWNS
ncbi:twitch domain-containing radical SAM protein [Pseudobdellovibrio exovorus]|uniref:Radical SAM core domain-containing protein n=1 Tax=Pseudobdellovibrio exovorus JSS TaxID=1184267 RepID=M4VB05_9BACT|nr:twitch domain-containing radical SAM protein [Pseudobdellovibrio exovorus]AGH96562.1 hypothetical protein A11Q_2346 [Pseudobdellovibrio exovorus JSS]